MAWRGDHIYKIEGIEGLWIVWSIGADTIAYVPELKSVEEFKQVPFDDAIVEQIEKREREKQKIWDESAIQRVYEAIARNMVNQSPFDWSKNSKIFNPLITKPKK